MSMTSVLQQLSEFLKTCDIVNDVLRYTTDIRISKLDAGPLTMYIIGEYSTVITSSDCTTEAVDCSSYAYIHPILYNPENLHTL